MDGRGIAGSWWDPEQCAGFWEGDPCRRGLPVGYCCPLLASAVSAAVKLVGASLPELSIKTAFLGPDRGSGLPGNPGTKPLGKCMLTVSSPGTPEVPAEA